jgi:hypothetical protein
MTSWTTFEGKARRAERPRGPVCAVARLLDVLPDDGKLAVEKALDNRALSASGISRALADFAGERYGDLPSAWSIRNHRRGECRCGRLR